MTKTKMDAATLHANLHQFIGTEAYHRCGLGRLTVCTDGVHYLRQNADCFWLTDAIASYMLPPEKMAKKYGEDFAYMSFWTLRKTEGNGAVLEARADSGQPPKIQQVIEFTDFPFPESGEFLLYVGVGECDGKMCYVAMLPSEY